MRPSTSSYIVELPLRVNDQQNRFLEKAFEFGRTLYNATLGSALGRLQRMRETQEWRVARDMPKGKARTKAFSAVHKAFGLTEFGLTIIANNHRKASGRKDIGAHEAQSIGKAVWRGLQRHMFQKAGRPRFKSFRRGLNSIEGTNNQEIMYKPERGAIVWRKHVMPYMKPDTDYMKEALAFDRRVKYCRIVRRTLNGVKRWFVQLVVEGLPPVEASEGRAFTALDSHVRKKRIQLRTGWFFLACQSRMWLISASTSTSGKSRCNASSRGRGMGSAFSSGG